MDSTPKQTKSFKFFAKFTHLDTWVVTGSLAPSWGVARHAPNRDATGERPEVGAELTPRSLECLRGGEGRRHRDIPTRVRCRGGTTGSSALAVGELRVEAAACMPGALAARSLDAEGAGPQRAGPRPRPSPHGGAPPAVRLPGVKSLSRGSSVHGLQHREGEMSGVKRERWERSKREKTSWDG
jgi:hypothetical protein